MKSKVTLNPRLFYLDKNTWYNAVILPLADDIFHTEASVTQGYILIGDYLLDEIKTFTPFTERQAAEENYDVNVESNTHSYENIVAHLMLNGKYNNYVIAGGMGTGKTSTCTYITNSIIEARSKKGDFIITLEFDFNGHYGDNDDDVITQFNAEIYNKLAIKIEEYFEDNEDAINQFCNTIHLRDKREHYSDFRAFDACKELNWRHNILNPDQKRQAFFSYLEHCQNKVSALMKIVYWFQHEMTGNTVLLVFDNIDVLTPFAQRKILRNIFKYNTIAKVKCFIPLRRATFKRTIRDIQRDIHHHAAYSYGYIHHHGVEPRKVVIARIKAYLADHVSSSDLELNDKSFAEHLLKRLKTYQQMLEEDNSFSRFFTKIVGRSSRVALTISKRFFVNNIIDYSNHDFYPDQAIKAFMAYKSPNYLFDNPGEGNIANVLCLNNYSDFNILPYLILNYSKKAQDIKEFEMRYIWEKISSSFKNRKDCRMEDFIDTVNYLLTVQRPLLWSDDKSFYESHEDMTKCENTLQFTELGSGYFELIRQNTQYLQECLMSISWEHDYIPQQFDSFQLGERFGFMRRCILEILNQEITQINYGAIAPLSTVLFSNIGGNLYNILSKRPSLINQNHEEILSWKSLRNDLYNTYNFNRQSREKISRFLDDYKGL
ncbi:MAG: hypothetical protein PSV16_12720 [Flavobacterium sp.]|nr:hypothetical protein [Flavobacterium sp.]